MGKFLTGLHVSFQSKVLLPVITILALLMLLTTWVVDRQLARQLEKEALERLATSEAVFKHFQEIHVQNLLARYRNLASEPRSKAISQLEDPKTLKQHFDALLGELDAQRLGADIILFTSAGTQRQVTASIDRFIDVQEFQRNSLASVQQVLSEGEANEDILRAGDRLFNIVSVPVTVSGQITAVITFANEIGEQVARDFSLLTGSEIVVLADDRVLVSTLRSAEQQRQFNHSLLQSAGDSIRRVVLGGEHFFWRATSFRTAGGEAPFGYVLLSSYEQSWQTLQQTQRLLLWVRATGLALAAFTIWMLIRRVTRPLRELRDAAEAVGRGDFSRRVKVSSRDECGDLAESFNQMTENVKHSRDQLEQTVETLKATRAQLVQSEKLSGIGEFVAGVAHELNNPLTAVIGFAELLAQSDGAEKHRTYSKRIVQSAERCQKVVQHLLSFARQQAPERKRVMLNDIVESVFDLLQYQLRTSNIQVTRDLDPGLAPLMADAHQLQQVFLNIVQNARQAMEGRADASIRVTTRGLGNRVRVVIQDNGPGISEEDIHKVFNPFFTTKPVGKGTGLGLSVSYGIIREHGGTITVKSLPGEGAAFLIEFPVATDDPPAAQAQGRPADSGHLDGAGRRLLVIDDEELILDLAREILATSGYQVETARDGEEALRHLCRTSYDLILCDWKMPGINGQQVFERLVEMKPEVADRFIFMTGDVMNPKTQDFLKTHGRTCLCKPFSVDDIVAVAKQVQPVSAV